jgi:hypothetical protein
VEGHLEPDLRRNHIAPRATDTQIDYGDCDLAPVSAASSGIRRLRRLVKQRVLRYLLTPWPPVLWSRAYSKERSGPIKDDGMLHAL